MNLLEWYALALEWSPRILLAGLVLMAVGIVGIVRHRRSQSRVVPAAGEPAAYVPGVAPVPSFDDDLMEVADAVRAGDR